MGIPNFQPYAFHRKSKMVARVARHITLRAKRGDLDATKSRVLLRPQAKLWHEPSHYHRRSPLGTAQTRNLTWVRTISLISSFPLYTDVSVSTYVQRGGWCRPRCLLSYCQGKAAQPWHQGQDLRFKFTVMGKQCSALRRGKLRKKKPTQKPKREQRNAVQGWASVLLSPSVCSITQHRRIK